MRSRPSFAGTGLLERMRSTTFALLGIMAAMGLGLVALISSQGLPVLPGLPVPGLSSEQGRVDDARAIAAPSSAPSLGPAAAPVARGAATRDERSDTSGLAGSRQLATAQDPVPADPGEAGVPSEESPVAPVPSATPASEAPPAAAPTESAPEPPAVAGTPPGKATAVIDPTEDEEGSSQAGVDEAAVKGSSRGGRSGGKASPPVTPPSQAQGDADVQGGGADVAEPSPSQAEIDEERSRGGGRGHGYGRSRH